MWLSPQRKQYFSFFKEAVARPRSSWASESYPCKRLGRKKSVDYISPSLGPYLCFVHSLFFPLLL